MKRLLLLPLLLFPLALHAQWEGYEIVRVRAEHTSSAIAKCPAGKIVINGGWQHEGYGRRVGSSYPFLFPDSLYGWVLRFECAEVDCEMRAVVAYAICVNAQQTASSDGDVTPDVAPAGALVFDGFSDTSLSKWVGKSGGAHSGSVVTDPLNAANKVLTLTNVIAAGDMFSQPIAVTPGVEYALCFDYMGRPVSTAGAGNGGAIGIAAGTLDNHRWLAGTSTGGGIEQGILEDDGQWHSYRVTFYPMIQSSSVSSLRIMLEDFTGTGGDVYFDDIKLVRATEGC